MSNLTPGAHPPVKADKPWRIVRYGLRHTYTIREFRRRWTAELHRRVRFFTLGDCYKVEPNYDWNGEPVVDGWLAEVLHVVWGVEMREHERHVLTAGHAAAALDAVPEHVLRAARIDRSQP